MMLTLLAVAGGGAAGALARFGISRIPALNSSAFPFATFAANLIGALIVGFIAGTMMSSHKLSANQLALLKTGFCGALTTFSTFSLESLVLFDSGRYALGIAYIMLSVVLCLAGVFIGRAIAVHCLA